MEYATIAGNYYTITSKSGCTVTDTTGTLEETVEAGKQLTVQAPSDKLICNDEQAIIFKSNFSFALARRSAGGGASTDGLPAGYIPAVFLESTGEQYIDTGFVPGNGEIVATYKASAKHNNTGSTVLMGVISPGTAANAPRLNFGYTVVASRMVHTVISLQMTSSSYEAKSDTVYSVKTTSWRKVGKLAKIEVNGQEGAVALTQTTYPGNVTDSLYIFGIHNNYQGQHVAAPKIWKCYSLSLSYDGVTKFDFVPALSPSGRPCMMNKLNGSPVYNANSGEPDFVIGLSLEQARDLWKLPDTGGKLIVSVPEGVRDDEVFVAACNAANAKGWNIEVRTYSDSSTASTYSLRRIYCRKRSSNFGQWVDADGSRWQIDWCVAMYGAEPEELGYELFRSVAAAAEYWELAEYTESEPIDISTTE